VGDVIDLWSLRRHTAWRTDHVAVIRRLLELARTGTRVVVIPGNHDEPLMQLGALGLEGIDVRPHAVLETAGGARYLVAHGHEQDPIFGTTHALIGLLCGIGERLGEVTRRLQSAMGLGGVSFTPRGWSGSPGRTEPSRFQMALATAARDLALDGVICAHSHAPADRVIGDVHYLNCGDWLNNCTAIVEDWSGTLRLVHRRASERQELLDNPELWLGEGEALAVNP
jgi:UDP-2,3-diacylglucosamine pyrophosphatase LpxH